MDRKAVKGKFESGELRSDSVVKESLTTAVVVIKPLPPFPPVIPGDGGFFPSPIVFTAEAEGRPHPRHPRARAISSLEYSSA